MGLASPDLSLLELLKFFLPKIGFAILCGGLLGLERELKHKPAGIKTNILICLGSTLYTSMSVLISARLAQSGHFGDPGRIAAQIVSGIGFLGGGTIIQSRGTIQGLTSAAMIWVVAAIGVCIGIGYADIGVLSTILVIITMLCTSWFEDQILGRSILFECEIVADDPSGALRHAIHQSLAQNNLTLDDFDMAQRDGLAVLTCKYSGNRTDQKKFILDLWGTTGIKEVRQL